MGSTKRKVPVFIVSDATGMTAERVISAALFQFRQIQPVYKRFPYIKTKEQMERILARAEGSQGIVICSLVSKELRRWLKDGRKTMKPISLDGDTIPHRIVGRFRSSRVVLVPASKGTGVIAGGTVRALMEAAGIRNILTKSLGNTNPVNMVKAAMRGLETVRTKAEVEKLRGVSIP